MALVRCPIHKIPYNDENPRGCPACAREREGAEAASAMQELARISRTMRALPDAPAEPLPKPRTSRATRWPVTEPPKPPTPAETWIDRVAERMSERRTLTTLLAAAVVLVGIVMVTSGPRFTALPDPAAAAGQPLPLPVEPGRSISTVFAILGQQPPRAVPDAPRLARYSYGSGLQIDGLNETVYAITFSVANRVWHGLRPGVPARQAEGALALLGTPRTATPPSVPAPRRIGKYLVYASLDTRPRRTLVAEVRPPNGCFDVQVDLQPRAVGILRSGPDRFAVVGVEDSPIEWIATRIRIINRRIRGPYAQGTAC